MSGYRVGAFEALEWAWHMLRSYRGRPGGIDEARRAIQDVLANMGRGDEMDFEKILQTDTYPQDKLLTTRRATGNSASSISRKSKPFWGDEHLNPLRPS